MEELMIEKCVKEQGFRSSLNVNANYKPQAKISNYFEPLGPEPTPCADFVIHGLDLVGEAERSVATFQAAFEVNILNRDKLVSVPLLSRSVALYKTDIKLINIQNTTQDKENGPPGQAYVTVMNGWHSLLAPHGSYQVTLWAYVPYTSSLCQSLELSIPHCTRNTLSLSVPHKGLAVVVQPSMNLVSQEDGDTTTVTCALPPVRNVSMKWTKLLDFTRGVSNNSEAKDEAKDASKDQAKDPAPAKEKVVTSGQDIIHSIGGGVVTSEVMLHYTITNGSVSIFELLVDGVHGSAVNENPFDTSKRVRVLNVDGEGVKKWEIMDDVDKPRAQRLKIFMDSEMEGKCSMTVQTELEMVSTSCAVSFPTFRPLNINRVQGNIVIQARTAVEINQGSATALSTVDVKEVPSNMIKGNVLHAYKFLTPYHQLCVHVIKHADVDVLMAVVEEALLDLALNGTQLLYDLQMSVRNTQSQFLRVTLPSSECVIWSASVSGETVKPCVDTASDQILLPMEKGVDEAFDVQISFVLTVTELTFANLSSLTITLPSINIPINKFFVTAYMPKEASGHHCLYGAWTGDLREVKEFSKPFGGGGGGGGGDKKKKRKLERRWSGDSVSSLVLQRQTSMDFQCMQHASEAPQKSIQHQSWGTTQGIKPMTMATSSLKVGEIFKFEKLIVNPRETFQISVEYKGKVLKAKRTLEKGCAVM